MRMYYLVPVDMCEFVCREKFFRPAQIYLYLKSQCSGKIKLTSKVIEEAADAIGVSYRTIKNNIKKLIQRNWIGLDKKSKMCFVRGFDKVCKIESWKSKTGAWWNVTKVKLTKGFFIGACISYLARVQKRNKFLELREKRLSAQQRVSAKHDKRFSLPTHYPMACNALAQIYGISTSTAYLWKQLADKYGFIDLKKKVKHISSNPKEYPYIKKGMSEVAHLLFIGRNGCIYMRLPDEVAPLVTFKRRPKTKSNKINMRTSPLPK